jgi:glycosyltransferase involved in cell wall biosynthesis
MRVIVTDDTRFLSTPNGAVWSSMVGETFYQRYLTAFDEVIVLARVKAVETVPDGWNRVDSDRISVCRIPYYYGVLQYVARRRQVVQTIESAATEDDAVILRLGQVGQVLSSFLTRQSRPFGLEVIGDPYDVFAPGAVRHPLRLFLRWRSPRCLRKLCDNAAAVAYVTESTLQKRYPPRPNAFTTHYSSIQLPGKRIVESPRSPGSFRKQEFTITFAGSFEQMYKAPDVLIRAVAQCVSKDMKLHLVMMGDGRHRTDVERVIEETRIGKYVTLLGTVTGFEAVQAEMDASDLFVLPSRTEGLPRVVIEAMARALPCIGTRVGGIPELLSEKGLVEPNDVEGLAERIREILSNPDVASALSARNLAESRKYEESVLKERRDRFYYHVREITTKQLKMNK